MSSCASFPVSMRDISDIILTKKAYLFSCTTNWKLQ